MPKAPTQFEHGGHQYQIRTMDALTQLSLAQRLSPIIVPFLKLATGSNIDASVLADVADKTDGGSMFTVTPEARKKAFAPVFTNMSDVAEVLQKMPVEITQSIYRDCLRHLFRQSRDGGGWQIVWEDRANRLMYEDIQGFDVLILCSEVVKDQLSNFITGALSKFSFAPPAQPTRQ